MLSLKKGKEIIYSTGYIDSLISYIQARMTLEEYQDAKKQYSEECGEYGTMWHLCLLENCEALEGYSLIIHKGK